MRSKTPEEKDEHTHTHTIANFQQCHATHYSEADFNSAKCFSWCVKFVYCVDVPSHNVTVTLKQ